MSYSFYFHNYILFIKIEKLLMKCFISFVCPRWERSILANYFSQGVPSFKKLTQLTYVMLQHSPISVGQLLGLLEDSENPQFTLSKQHRLLLFYHFCTDISILKTYIWCLELLKLGNGLECDKVQTQRMWKQRYTHVTLWSETKLTVRYFRQKLNFKNN